MLKNILKKIYFSKFLSKVIFFIKRYTVQILQSFDGHEIIYLGTEYGGWSLVNLNNLENCTIISAGLGEDASFDIEFANKYNAKVIIVDPTPKAIKHYNEIINSLGKISTTKYIKGGKQPISSYNLSKLKKDNLILFKKALWNKNQNIRFYSPPNPKHVSYSIINFQNKYALNTSFIKVEAITIDNLLDELRLNKNDIPLIKLDIEGAEIEFLIDCFKKNFKPKQILVEFDELNKPSKIGYKRVKKINQLLVKNNYKLLKRDGKANFLYFYNKKNF